MLSSPGDLSACATRAARGLNQGCLQIHIIMPGIRWGETKTAKMLQRKEGDDVRSTTYPVVRTSESVDPLRLTLPIGILLPAL